MAKTKTVTITLTLKEAAALYRVHSYGVHVAKYGHTASHRPNGRELYMARNGIAKLHEALMGAPMCPYLHA